MYLHLGLYYHLSIQLLYCHFNANSTIHILSFALKRQGRGKEFEGSQAFVDANYGLRGAPKVFERYLKYIICLSEYLCEVHKNPTCKPCLMCITNKNYLVLFVKSLIIPINNI